VNFLALPSVRTFGCIVLCMKLHTTMAKELKAFYLSTITGTSTLLPRGTDKAWFCL
jgi:hypothetical protein